MHTVTPTPTLRKQRPPHTHLSISRRHPAAAVIRICIEHPSTSSTSQRPACCIALGVAPCAHCGGVRAMSPDISLTLTHSLHRPGAQVRSTHSLSTHSTPPHSPVVRSIIRSWRAPSAHSQPILPISADVVVTPLTVPCPHHRRVRRAVVRVRCVARARCVRWVVW